jgi:2-polyprenyl-3-methyl-5-hydroxy-6-metoxy-1,4-benzoquinol methylase
LHTLTLRYILPDIRRRGLREVTFLDLGAGGGDFALWLVGLCRRNGLRAKVTALDHDPRVVKFARENTAHCPEVRVIQAEAFQFDQLEIPPHYIFANHFLHHLPDSEIPPLLAKAYHTAEYGLLINDVHRTRVAFLAYTLLSGLCLRGSFAYADGRSSIRRGFLVPELQEHIRRAGLEGKTLLRTVPPGHFFIVGLK